MLFTKYQYFPGQELPYDWQLHIYHNAIGVVPFYLNCILLVDSEKSHLLQIIRTKGIVTSYQNNLSTHQSILLYSKLEVLSSIMNKFGSGSLRSKVKRRSKYSLFKQSTRVIVRIFFKAQFPKTVDRVSDRKMLVTRWTGFHHQISCHQSLPHHLKESIYNLK